MTGSDGEFEIDLLSPGTHIIWAWAPNCLSASIGAVYISTGDIVDVEGSLFPGDLHQDGRINLYDTGEILGSLHATPDSSLWDPVLDLDGNSVIDSLDLSLLVDHWKETDEVEVPAWQIEVLEPYPDDIWWIGQRDVEILWTTANLGGDVSIYLLYAGTIADTIALATPNDGEYSEYDVPTDLDDSGGYNVMVSSEEPIAGVSDNFAVRQAIVISKPGSDSAWWPGGYAGINWWNRSGSTSDVSLYLYKGEEFRYTIVEGRQHDLEFYDWTVPEDVETGDDYRVKASYDETPWISNFSEYFNIRPRFQIFEPNSYTTWLQGQENVTISWEPAELGGTVTIRLLRRGGSIDLIAEETPNDGLYEEYDVPFNLEPGDYYFVEVYYNELFNARSGYIEVIEAAPQEN
jgi:hypothetical protein